MPSLQRQFVCDKMHAVITEKLAHKKQQKNCLLYDQKLGQVHSKCYMRESAREAQ